MLGDAKIPIKKMKSLLSDLIKKPDEAVSTDTDGSCP